MPNHCRDFLPLVVFPEGSKRQGTFCAAKKKKPVRLDSCRWLSPTAFQVQGHSDASPSRGIVVRDLLPFIKSTPTIQCSGRLPSLVYPQLNVLAALLSQALLNVGHELLTDALAAGCLYHTDLVQEGHTFLPHIDRVGDEARPCLLCRVGHVEDPRVGLLSPQFLAEAEGLIGGEGLLLDA